MALSISSNSSDTNSRQPFPTYLKRRNALLQLVGRQRQAAERFRLDNHELCRLSSTTFNKTKPVVSVDKFTLTNKEDLGGGSIDACCQVSGGHGDAKIKTETDFKQQQTRKVMQKIEEESNEEKESIDLGWTLRFDSKTDLTNYKKSYISAVQSLVECNELYAVQAQKKQAIPITMEAGEIGNEKPPPLPPPMQKSAKSPSTTSRVHKSKGDSIYHNDDNHFVSSKNIAKKQGLDLKTARRINKAVSEHLSFIPPPTPRNPIIVPPHLGWTYLVGVIVCLIVPLYDVGCRWWSHINQIDIIAPTTTTITAIFNFIEETPWPWLVFLKEPLAKGFIKSSDFSFAGHD